MSEISTFIQNFKGLDNYKTHTTCYTALIGTCKARLSFSRSRGEFQGIFGEVRALLYSGRSAKFLLP